MGGRTAGTPNKDKPIKTFLRAHSQDYFDPARGKGGKSQYEIDLACMEPAERVDAELKLLNYHTPKMQATTVDVAMSDGQQSLAQRLAALAKEND